MQQGDAPRDSGVLEGLRERHKLVCVAAGKSTDKKESYAVAGTLQQGSDRKLEVNHKWPLLSMTKAMTATLIALLVKDGLLSWDSTLGDLLSDIPQLHPSHHDLTVKMITAQRTGLVGTWGETFQSLLKASRNPDLTPVEARFRRTVDVLSLPSGNVRGTFTYNNSNYIILGCIIDRITRSSWEEAIHERLFMPLGMNDTSIWPATATEVPTVGHFPSVLPFLNPTRFWPSLQQRVQLEAAGAPAGGACCTMQECNKFLRLHADGARGKPGLGLTKEDFAFLHTPYSTEKEKDEFERYTFGGWVRPYDMDHGEDDYCVWHPGGWLWYSTQGHIDVRSGNVYMAFTDMGWPGAVKALHDIVDTMREGELL